MGGSVQSGQMRLLRLTATAAGYSDDLLVGNAPGDVPLLAEQIALIGRPLTPSATWPCLDLVDNGCVNV